jgi:hypothetical protein
VSLAHDAAGSVPTSLPPFGSHEKGGPVYSSRSCLDPGTAKNHLTERPGGERIGYERMFLSLQETEGGPCCGEEVGRVVRGPTRFWGAGSSRREGPGVPTQHAPLAWCEVLHGISEVTC